MKIAVVGLGAVGTVYGCLLKKSGHEVWGVELPEEAAEIKELGFSVTGLWGRKRAQPDVVTDDLAALRGQGFDLVIAAVKAPVLESVLEGIAAALGATGKVLLLQDGYGNYEAAAAVISPDRIVNGVQSVEMKLLEVGDSKVVSQGEPLRIGSVEGKMSPAELEALAAMLNDAGIETTAVTDITAWIWANIIINASLATISAVVQSSYGKLLQENESKVIVDNSIKEIFDLLDKLGLKTIWPDAAACQEDLVAERIGLRSMRMSPMLEDLRRGRPAEMDWFNGAVCRLALENGMLALTNEMIRTMFGHKEKLGVAAVPSEGDN
ncbi:MAG: 2-dehydropantoate 2-reductase [Syntrophomonadaceae bacterium]|nr:2-dehydropantoate 2-reductase [Syntrophomonadaceae bacterium]